MRKERFRTGNCSSPGVAKKIEIPEMLVRIYDLHAFSIRVKDFLHRRPPLTFGARVERLLHGLHDGPPTLAFFGSLAIFAISAW